MRRFIVLSALLSLLIPASVEAQPRLMFGGGLSNPSGTLSNEAAAGFHARAGLQVGVPTFPLSLRADGEYHAFGEEVTGVKPKILDGTLSLVLSLGGIGLSPYVLAGIGSYNYDSGLSGVDRVTGTGYHGGFGVSIGALGFGGWVEIRYISVGGQVGRAFIPVTVGLRL